MTVVTRFAPSPTGYLHVGGARTALYCWLYAHKKRGNFILRIEDTDRERSTRESVQGILDGMKWLNLYYDEGPYYQSQRSDRYAEVLKKLLKEGHAYVCTCTKERLENLRESQMAKKEKPRYDGFCRNLERPVMEENCVIRFKNPLTGVVEFEDLIRGKLSFNNSELDDLVLVRSDGTPTYNFCVVVDDWDMHVSHVIRGDDHINNTPRQINIFKALEVKPPYYAHVPMILGSDGKRLSKRHGAVNVMQYREEGFLPQALLNYLVRLGWSHGDQEVFSVPEMIEHFEIEDINRSPAAFNLEKLIWLNQYYLKYTEAQDLEGELAWHMKQLGINIHSGPSLIKIIEAQRDRVKTLREMAEKSRCFFTDEISYNQESVAKHITPDTKRAMIVIRDGLSDIPWSKEEIHRLFVTVAEKMMLKLGQIAQPVRVAVMGDTISPPIDVTIALMGKERVIKRLDHALNFFYDNTKNED